MNRHELEPSRDYTRDTLNIFSGIEELQRTPEKENSLNDIHGLPYEPDLWNDDWRIQDATNCYAYALNLTRNPITNKPFPFEGSPEGFGLCPGELGGFPYMTLEDLNSNNIIERCKADAKASGGIFIEAVPGVPAPPGAWKVALVVYPEWDYHWYRQNTDGTWSHKPSNLEVTDVDASRNTITDPEKSEQDFDFIRHSEFAGYFYVRQPSII